MAVVAPLHGFRLLMIRTVAVLVACLGLNGLATLALPEYGLRALGWLLPALALTTTGLALIPRLGPVLAPSLVGGGWALSLLAAYEIHGGTLAPFTPAGQGVAAMGGRARRRTPLPAAGPLRRTAGGVPGRGVTPAPLHQADGTTYAPALSTHRARQATSACPRERTTCEL